MRTREGLHDKPRPTLKDRATSTVDAVQGSQAWSFDLPAGFDLPQGLHRQPPQPLFFYRPETTAAWNDIQNLQTSVTFGLLVRNMHRWGAHLMVLAVFLHMARVFYHGAYKPPREFNWVIGIVLLALTIGLSFTGYLLPWDQLALWAVTVGGNMAGYTPVFGDQVRFVLLDGKEIGPDTLLRWYVLHVLFLPFVIVIFMAIHFWRVRKDGGISGPL